MTDPLEQATPADAGTPEILAAYPELSDGSAGATPRLWRPDELEVGEAAFAAGDPTYDLIVIDEGAIEVVRPATVNAPEASVITFGPGAFVGELGLLTGQITYLTARVVERTRVHRISPPQLRHLMARTRSSPISCSERSSHVAGGSAPVPRLASCRSSAANWIPRPWRFVPTPGDGSCLTSGWTSTRSRADRSCAPRAYVRPTCRR